MNIAYGNGKTESGPGVRIVLTGEEVAQAIAAWLVVHGVHVQGPRTIRVNGDLCEAGSIYVDPSGSVITPDGVNMSGRGPVIESEFTAAEMRALAWVTGLGHDDPGFRPDPGVEITHCPISAPEFVNNIDPLPPFPEDSEPDRIREYGGPPTVAEVIEQLQGMPPHLRCYVRPKYHGNLRAQDEIPLNHAGICVTEPEGKAPQVTFLC